MNGMTQEEVARQMQGGLDRQEGLTQRRIDERIHDTHRSTGLTTAGAHRLLALQQKQTLTEGERMELDLLLRRQWGP